MTRHVTAARVYAEFGDGLSIVGLARKYGRTKRQIEDMIRREWRRRR